MTDGAGVMQGWNDFFMAEAGAAAALAGLLFVAVSINLKRILKFPHLPARAVEALVALVSVLAVSTWALVPGQPPMAYGLEIGGTGLAVWIAQTATLWTTFESSRKYPRLGLRVAMCQLSAIPFVVAGLLLCLGRPGALYWTVPGTLFSFACGLYDTWVLLVEIQR
jgi:hypothetical protein